MNNKQDIEEALITGFKELTAERPIEKITIKEITDRAGVIRPTFYNHFQDKFELMERMITNELLLPMKPLISAGMFKESLTLLFTNIAKEKAYYSRAVNLDGPMTFHQIAMNAVREFFLGVLKELTTGKTPKYIWLSPDVMSTFYAQAMVFAAEEWIKTGMTLEPGEMAEAYDYIMSRSFNDIINEM